MKRALAYLLLVGLMAPAGVLSSPEPALAQEDSFVFQGRGWGHGVGMPQYGARVQAMEGRSAYQILQYYYQGVDPDAPIPGSFAEPIWIGLLQNQIEIGFEARDGSLTIWQLVQPGEARIVGTADAGERWTLRTTAGGKCQFLENGNPVSEPLECWASILRNGSGTQVKLDQTGFAYGRGALRIRPALHGAFHASLEIDLQQYLYGLFEMPFSWPMEALKAQAIAARTYSVRKVLERGLGQDRQDLCWCHLYATVLDQNYVGSSREGEIGWGDRWVKAIDDTINQIITHPAAPDAQNDLITAFYFSSSGGYTENSEDVFGGAAPFLVSVEDHWSISDAANNRFRSWEKPMTVSEVAAALAGEGFASVHTVTVVDPPPGAKLEFKGKDRAGNNLTKTISGARIRSLLGLRSGFVTGVTKIVHNPFTDISGSVHESAILAIWREGITAGCQPDRYCPNDPVRRWQMAVFLWKALGLPDATVDHFSDDNGHPYERQINAVAEAGLAKGCGPGRFCPNGTVTRAEMAAFLIQALSRHLGEDHAGHLPGHVGYFTDVPPGQWYTPWVEHLKEHNITAGYPDGTYRPSQPVTRAEMATFLARTLGLS